MFKVLINGQTIQLYESFSVNKSLSNFVDTFTITLWNPWWIFSRTIPIWSYFNLYWDWAEIFRWICEKKTVTLWQVGSKLTFSWREEMLLLTEDDITPLHKDYKNIADNIIIEDICKWYWWKLELNVPKIIAEYKISDHWVRKWEVLEDITSSNNFYLFKIWWIIYKKELPRESDYTDRKRPQFTLSSQWWWFTDFNNRILDVNISEDITAAKSNIQWFTYWKWKNKPVKIIDTQVNKELLDWSYPSRLRNIWDKISAPVIKRFVSQSVTVKSKKELTALLKKAKVANDIQIEVEITIAEVLNLHMLDTAEIFIQDENIKQYMYIKEMSYNYDSFNKFYTKFVFSPIVPIENE